MAVKHKTLPAGVDRPSFTGITPSLYAEEHAFSGGAQGSVLTRNTGNSDGAGWVASAAGVLLSTGVNQIPSFGNTLPNAVQDNITRTGTITSGVWNAGSVTSSSSVADSVSTMAIIRANSAKALVNGRLTLESGVAVSTSDQSAKATLYFTPYKGNCVGLYTGSIWEILTFSEISLSLGGLTASKPYDIFAYNNSGSLALEALVWTNATTRATALVAQDGVWVKTGATTRRYVGTVYINATGGQSDDSYAKRYVWNAYNYVTRPMRKIDGTDSYTYSTATLRQVNADATNQLDFVIGLPEIQITARVTHTASGSAANLRYVTTIGLDSTTTSATGALIHTGCSVSTQQTSAGASLSTYPGIGRHTLVWLESNGPDGGTITWYGDSVAAADASGISAFLEG